MTGDIPFRLDGGSLLTSAILLITAGMAGSLFALRRITRIDPAIALSNQT
jgi:putative ABC transport system permease protein